MAYNSISITPYTKSHLELKREITLIELTPSPYFFAKSICVEYMNMFAMFDENPAMILQDIKEHKHNTLYKKPFRTNEKSQYAMLIRYPPNRKSQ